MLAVLRRQISNIELYVVIASVVILAGILLIKPISGVANNGDYSRVMTRAGLEFHTDSRFVNLDQYYKIKDVKWVYEKGRSYLSSHLLAVRAAIKLNKLIKSRDTFDIRALGIVYTVIFILGIYLTARFARTHRIALDILLAVLLVFILCDVGYVSYFNSFLGEASIIVFFLLLFGILLFMAKSRKISLLLILIFFFSSVLFISAKQSNVPMGIFIALFGLSVLLVDRRRKTAAAMCLCTAALLGVTLLLYFSVPDNMEKITKHQTVFYGILKDSPTPEEDLEFLGLSRKLAVLKEASYYDNDLPIPSNSGFLTSEFYNKISFGKVFAFYLFHPSRFIEKLEVTAKNSTMIRPPYLGNFKFEDTGERLGFSSKFSLWSTLKKTYMPNSLLFIAVLFSVYLAGLLYEYGKVFRKKVELNRVLYINIFLLLWITGAAQFVIPVLGDGEVDLAKHMLLYNLCFDMMLLSAVMWITNKLSQYFSSPVYKKPLKTSMITLSFLLCAAYVLMVPSHAKEQPENTNGHWTAINIGGHIKFGRYGGTDIIWQVIYKDKDRIGLIADKVICFKPFDAAGSSDVNKERRRFGSNDWLSSTLRTWLNSDDKTVDYGLQPPNVGNVWKGINSYDNEPGFLYAFTENEKKAIKTVTHKSLLSTFDMDQKEGGSTYYFWTNSVPLLEQNFENAYFRNVDDRVFPPDVIELKEYVYDHGLKCKRSAASAGIDSSSQRAVEYVGYWLRTPYATRASFVRYVGSDGYVYHKDAFYGDMGVLPVLFIDADS